MWTTLMLGSGPRGGFSKTARSHRCAAAAGVVDIQAMLRTTVLTSFSYRSPRRAFAQRRTVPKRVRNPKSRPLLAQFVPTG